MMNKRKCESCGDSIDENQIFESSDEEIYETVMDELTERNVCIECALTKAVMQQTMSDDCEPRLMEQRLGDEDN